MQDTRESILSSDCHNLRQPASIAADALLRQVCAAAAISVGVSEAACKHCRPRPRTTTAARSGDTIQ
jgi:hypothetical protein